MIDRARDLLRNHRRSFVWMGFFWVALHVFGFALPGALTGTRDWTDAVVPIVAGWPAFVVIGLLKLPSRGAAPGPLPLPRRRRQAIRLGVFNGLLCFVVVWLVPSHGPLDRILAAHLAGALSLGLVTAAFTFLLPPTWAARPLPAHPTRGQRLDHWLRAGDVPAAEPRP